MIIIVPKYILPFGYGLTLYRLALVREDCLDINYVIRHEKVHIRQWTEIGFFKFPVLYAIELVKNGYRNNKYEIEARKA